MYVTTDNLNDPRRQLSRYGKSKVNELPSCVLKDSVAVYDN